MRRSTARKNFTTQDARDLRTLLLVSVFQPESIGHRLAEARREAGLTQEELARLVNVSTRSQQGYESGAVVPYKQMQRYAAVLKKPVEWLLHGDPEDETAIPEAAAATQGDLVRELEELRQEMSELRSDLRRLLERLAPGEGPPAASSLR